MPEKDRLAVYDPFCGGGTLLAVLGFLAGEAIGSLTGSDLDETVLETAKQNLGLLSRNGLAERRAHLQDLFDLYHKPSHREAVESADRLAARLPALPVTTRVFAADACAPAEGEGVEADIVVTDIPYGRLVTWQGEAPDPMPAFMARIGSRMAPQGVLAVCASSAQKLPLFPGWRRLERQKIGKRQFALYTAG